jgi:Zn-dependent peptidase ImmA (M78 family)
MKWVIDTTGRFRWRPYYHQEELDTECERIVLKFMFEKYGVSHFPLSTDDLSIMIERDTSDLDLYADLSGDGEDVEGLTDFFINKKPAVKIAQELSLDDSRYTRLRTTLAHEYGHVRFHTFLWDTDYMGKLTCNYWEKISRQRRKYEVIRAKFVSGNDLVNYHALLPKNVFSADSSKGIGPRCKRTRMLDAPISDWMEWQASYIGGALLMPVSLLRKLVREKMNKWGACNRILSDLDRARELINGVAEAFDVSADAARVRLFKLGFLQNTQPEDNSIHNMDLVSVSP